MNGEQFRGTCRQYMELRHIGTVTRLGEHTSVSNKTFLKYWHNPDLLPMGVFEEIMDCLNVPKEARRNLID